MGHRYFSSLSYHTSQRLLNFNKCRKQKEPIAQYVIAIAILTAALTTIKRKTTRRER